MGCDIHVNHRRPALRDRAERHFQDGQRVARRAAGLDGAASGVHRQGMGHATGRAGAEWFIIIGKDQAGCRQGMAVVLAADEVDAIGRICPGSAIGAVGREDQVDKRPVTRFGGIVERGGELEIFADHNAFKRMNAQYLRRGRAAARWARSARHCLPHWPVP